MHQTALQDDIISVSKKISVFLYTEFVVWPITGRRAHALEWIQ